MDHKRPPHPDTNPHYSKADYMRNAVYGVAKIQLALYMNEGANLHEAGYMVQELQQCIERAYHSAVQEAGIDILGPPHDPPDDGHGLSDDNPFAPSDDEE